MSKSKNQIKLKEMWFNIWVNEKFKEAKSEYLMVLWNDKSYFVGRINVWAKEDEPNLPS